VKSTEPGSLTHAEQATLCLIAQGRTPGDRVAAEARLVRQYAGMVAKLAYRIPPAALDPDDALQEARLGLVNAIRGFNPGRGVRLSTFAQHCIVNALFRAMAQTSNIIRLPVYVYTELRRADRVTRELEARLGRMPTDEETAAECGAHEEHIRAQRQVPRFPISLEATATASNGDTLSLADILPADGPLLEDAFADLAELRHTLEPALAALTGRQREVICRRYGLPPYDWPQTVREAAAWMDVTPQAIHNTERAALRCIRHVLGAPDTEEAAA
jgi:RNA polymerase primary sigma factor